MMRHPWTAFYWDDWDADTSHLTMVEKGAYLELLKHYYRTGLPLTANAEHLLRICSAHTEQEKDAITSVLVQFFTLDATNGHDCPSLYRNKRADLELAKRSEITVKRSAAGQKAWTDKDANAKQMHSKSNANASGLLNDCPPHPHPQSHTQEDQKKERVHPSIEDVSRYCVERQNSVDPQVWVDHYISNGWKVGRNPMKDWKAAVRKWEKNSFSTNTGKRLVNSTVGIFDPTAPQCPEPTCALTSGHQPWCPNARQI